MSDFGYEAQQAAEKHLDACQDALYAEESEEGDAAELWPAELLAPFCGCTTCVVREVLVAAWPILELGFRAESSGRPTMGLPRVRIQDPLDGPSRTQ